MYNGNALIYQQVKETFDSYRKILREIDSLANQWEAEVKECDQAFSDIRHYCEFNKKNVDRATKTKITKLLADYSERRRIAKDNLIVLNQFIAYGRSHTSVLSELDKIAGDIKKQAAYVTGQRVYNPRVLTELFERKVAE
jgi:chromosomal replication initiation ATPase DnaA